MTAIYYTDDTFVKVERDTVDAVQKCTNVAHETISDHIRGLGLSAPSVSRQVIGRGIYKVLWSGGTPDTSVGGGRSALNVPAVLGHRAQTSRDNI